VGPAHLSLDKALLLPYETMFRGVEKSMSVKFQSFSDLGAKALGEALPIPDDFEQSQSVLCVISSGAGFHIFIVK
jgi:hypothetical protein